jgi:hypothetical protein
METPLETLYCRRNSILFILKSLADEDRDLFILTNQTQNIWTIPTFIF